MVDKKLVNKNVVRALSLGLALAMASQPITASAAEVADGHEDDQAVNQMKESSETVVKAVEAAHDADKAASEAADAAEDALQAAKDLEAAAAESVNKGYSEVVSEDEANQQNTVEEEVTEAEAKAKEVNAEIDNLNGDLEAAVSKIVKDADRNGTADFNDDIDAKQEALDEAFEAVDEARADAAKALEATIAAQYKDEALKAADEADKAATLAEEKAADALVAYNDAVDLYNKANKDYNELLEIANKLYGEQKDKFDEELKEAEDTLALAKAGVEAAKAEYDKSVTESTEAADYAETAAAKAKEASDNAQVAIDNLEALKQSGEVEVLRANRDTAQKALKDAEDNKTAVDTTQNAEIKKQNDIIATETATSNAKQNEINSLTGEISSLNNQIAAQGKIISDNSTVAEKTTKDIKSTVYKWYYKDFLGRTKECDEDAWHLNKWKEVDYYIYYSQNEIDTAKANVKAASEAKQSLENTKTQKNTALEAANNAKKTADGNVVAANNAIATANAAKTAANNAVTSAKNELTARLSELAVIEDFIYSDNGVTISYKDLDDQAKVTQLIKDAVATQSKLGEIRDDVKTYEDSIDYDNFWKWCAQKLNPWSDEYKIERKYRDWDWKWSDAETHVFKSNDSNLAFLVDVRNDQLHVVLVDEAELATYVSTFDKAAAAQAAARAADAAKAEAVALGNYQDALKKLETAKARLDKLSLTALANEKDSEALALAALQLKQAEERVSVAESVLRDAEGEAEAARQDAEAAKEKAAQKPNRPISGPSEDVPGDEIERRVIEVVEEEPAPAVPVAAVVRRAAAPAAPAAEVVEIETLETALAAAVEETEAEEPEVLDIEIPETALAATPVNEESISWWWLLIIAVLGATGYAMYKKHQEKKAETIEK